MASARPSRQRHWVQVNRAAVLTAWAAVVAERLGMKRDEALTMGRAVAGLSAYSKGKRLGLVEPATDATKRARRRARAPLESFAQRGTTSTKTSDRASLPVSEAGARPGG